MAFRAILKWLVAMPAHVPSGVSGKQAAREEHPPRQPMTTQTLLLQEFFLANDLNRGESICLAEGGGGKAAA